MLAEEEPGCWPPGPERLVLRVDRTDPSKNVVRGFHAFARFLARHPEWHGRVQMLALLDPSRQEIPDYAEYVGAIHRAAREVNDQFSDPGWTPIDLRVSDNFAQAIAAYKQYDVLLVNAIVDGMNLIAKEAPLVNERAGVLVLSENAGRTRGARRLRALGQPVRRGGDGRRHRGGARRCRTSERERRAEARSARTSASTTCAPGSSASWPTSTRSWRVELGERLDADRRRAERHPLARSSARSVPLTAEELAAEAKRAVDAGAGLVHVHARKKDGLPAFDLFIEDVVRAIRGEGRRARSRSRPSAPAARRSARSPRCSTCSASCPTSRRSACAPPEPDLPAHREEARQILEACERAGVRPEPVAIGVDSLGDFETLYNDSLLSKAPYIVAELGPSDGRGSDRMAGTPHNVLRLADACRATFSRFDVVMSGQDEASPIAQAVAAAAGHHVRCGFQDAATLPGRQRGRRRTPSSSRWRCASRRPSAGIRWSRTRCARCCAERARSRRRCAGAAPG